MDTVAEDILAENGELVMTRSDSIPRSASVESHRTFVSDELRSRQSSFDSSSSSSSSSTSSESSSSSDSSSSSSSSSDSEDNEEEK